MVEEEATSKVTIRISNFAGGNKISLYKALSHIRVGELIEMKHFILYVAHKREIVYSMQTEKNKCGRVTVNTLAQLDVFRGHLVKLR